MNHPARDPVAEIDGIGERGFDSVDSTLEPPAADPGRIDVAAVRAALDNHSLGVVAHTAYYLPLASPFAILSDSDGFSAYQTFLYPLSDKKGPSYQTFLDFETI